MRHVPRKQDGSCLAKKLVAQPYRRIVRLQTANRAEPRQWIAGTPEGFGGLPRAQFSAVPHQIRLDAAQACLLRQASDRGPSRLGQRPHGVNLGAHGVAVVDEANHREMIYTDAFRVRGDFTDLMGRAAGVRNGVKPFRSILNGAKSFRSTLPATHTI